MHLLAYHPVGRLALRGAVVVLRPMRFALGISRRVERPLEELLAL
jgi:hypothetical protein